MVFPFLCKEFTRQISDDRRKQETDPDTLTRMRHYLSLHIFAHSPSFSLYVVLLVLNSSLFALISLHGLFIFSLVLFCLVQVDRVIESAARATRRARRVLLSLCLSSSAKSAARMLSFRQVFAQIATRRKRTTSAPRRKIGIKKRRLPNSNPPLLLLLLVLVLLPPLLQPLQLLLSPIVIHRF